MKQVARETPEKIVKYYLNPLEQFLPYQAREIASKMGVPHSNMISSIGGIHHLETLSTSLKIMMPTLLRSIPWYYTRSV